MNAQRSEILLGTTFFGILALLVIPLPPTLLDFFFALSITVSLLILLVALYVEKPLDFSVFPSLLLIVTLTRLGLNVASTRLILIGGADGPDAAGRVIQAFGDIAVGGNYLVGIILFLIFVTINFVVISKGSGRIAEVAARFTLDAMPGKQMAIDADLNQGILDEAEAKQRRKDIQREADFYGAMDGASKFVKGDAIAGLVIMAVNILGGLAVGVIQGGMGVTDAIETYTLLTVGDGLVGQVPALVVSTAAGMVVTRAAAGDTLSAELGTQIMAQPRAVYGAAGMLGVMAMIPGFPFLPFAGLAAGAAYFARTITETQKNAEPVEQEFKTVEPEVSEEEEVRGALALDDLELEIGYGLIPLVDPDRGGDLLPRVRAMRKQLATELGFVIPLIHIRDNLQLEPGEYAVLVRGNQVARSRIPPGRLLAIQPGEGAPEIPGIATKDPAFGLPAVWIQDRDKERATTAGYAVVDSASALATHLAETIRRFAPELLTRANVMELLDAFSRQSPKVVEEIVPALVSVSVLHRTLRQLLEEGVSVRDIGSILETLAEYSGKIEDPDLLTDLVRERLGRTITRPFLDSEGTLNVITLEPGLEETLKNGVQRSQGGSYLAVDPSTLDRLVRGVEAQVHGLPASGDTGPVLLSPQQLRSPLRQLLSRSAPRVAVVSHNELPPDVRIVATGQVELAEAAGLL
ncbi:MAG: flagellar biosynthesis protein FlhA [bacterium]|nr:flagellar biosynthesis protein FlhA [bacterium]